ncbi:MAG TPA: UPF0280 family protein [Clostridia bacterium]|nr:UPF0280 family protein [Clostridia bacterium]
MGEERFYRRLHGSNDLVYFNVKVKETDLDIGANWLLVNESTELVKRCRRDIEDYIKTDPKFLASLDPLSCGVNAPPIIKEMCRAAIKAGVGPMAAVSGAISQYVGRELSGLTREIIVENGGDIYIKSDRDRIIGVYAGESPLSSKVGIKIRAGDCPMGICTSSGKVGHSLSFGYADAVVILASDTILADAVATAAGNLVKTADNIQDAIDFAKGIEGVTGTVIIMEDKLGAWGDVELVRL